MVTCLLIQLFKKGKILVLNQFLQQLRRMHKIKYFTSFSPRFYGPPPPLLNQAAYPRLMLSFSSFFVRHSQSPFETVFCHKYMKENKYTCVQQSIGFLLNFYGCLVPDQNEWASSYSSMNLWPLQVPGLAGYSTWYFILIVYLINRIWYCVYQLSQVFS